MRWQRASRRVAQAGRKVYDYGTVKDGANGVQTSWGVASTIVGAVAGAGSAAADTMIQAGEKTVEAAICHGPGKRFSVKVLC
jgi:hypothetical protein